MMKTEYGKIEGDYEITDELDLHGMITGNVNILKHGKLILHGTIGRNLTITKGGAVQIYGTVGGDVNNQGGHLEVFGTIDGNLYKGGGSTYIDPDAVVKGNIRD